MPIISNIIKFEDQPFMNPLTIFEYEKKDYVNFRQLGDIIRNLRKVTANRKKIIIQFKNKIISDQLLLDDLEKNLANHIAPSQSRIVSLKNIEDLEIVRRLVGEAIAVHLRHSIQRQWRIEEIYNSIFEVSNTEIIDNFDEIDVFTGFQYSPIVLKNGDAGVIIDLKYKFHSSKSLRDKFAYTNIHIDPNHTYVDICPVTDCPEKKDPFSNCKYAGTGKTLRLKDISEKSPSDIVINGINLIDFHKQKHICPNTPLLSDYIRDEPPVAISSYHDETNGFYIYPIERIREKPTFSLLDAHDRGRLMKQIRPSPKFRYSRSMNYVNYINSISIGSSIKLVFDRRSNWGFDNFGRLQSVSYLIKNNRQTNYPSIDIQEHGIYDKNPSKFNLQLILFRKYKKQDIDLLKLPFNDEVAPIILFNSFIKSKINILEPLVFDDDHKIQTYMPDPNGITLFIVVHSSADKINSTTKDVIIQKLILMDIPNKGINFDSFYEKYKNKQNGYFRNLYLTIIAKLGLMAWVLKVVENTSVKYIGLQSYNIIDDDKKYGALFSSYINSGRFTGGYYLSTTVEKRRKELETVFKELVNGAEEIILLKNGTILDAEFNDIVNTLKKMRLNYSIIEIISSSPLRIYTKSNNQIYRPDSGSYFKISRNEVGLVTTQVNVGTQNPIVIRNIRCLPSRFDALLQEIFHLSQCYTGWDKIETRLPVPVHTASKGLSKLPSSMNSFSFKRPWFM